MIIIKIQNTHTLLVLDAFSVTCPSLLLPPLISKLLVVGIIIRMEMVLYKTKGIHLRTCQSNFYSINER